MASSAKLSKSVYVIDLSGSASLRRDRGDELPTAGTPTIFLYSGVNSCTVQAQSERANMVIKEAWVATELQGPGSSAVAHPR